MHRGRDGGSSTYCNWEFIQNYSFSYRLGYFTVYQIVIEICRAIVHRLMPEVMPTTTKDCWKQITQDFGCYRISGIAYARWMERTSINKLLPIVVPITSIIIKLYQSFYLFS